MNSDNFKLESESARQALCWIILILEQYKIKYQISGGLATKIYGATRPLADIDIDLPNQSMLEIFHEIQPYVIYGPARYDKSPWNIFLITLDYQGQEIDLVGIDDAFVFNEKTNEWIKYSVDFSAVIMMTIEMMQLPIINRTNLIKYKSVLGRKVDISDINELRVDSNSRQ